MKNEKLISIHCIFVYMFSLIMVILFFKFFCYQSDLKHTPKTTPVTVTVTDTIECFHDKTADSLPDISQIAPRKGKSIFFHETSCKSFYHGKIHITARQACAVESAAKMNPNLDVYLLYSSPGLIKMEGDESDLFLNALMSYKNVQIMHLDYEKYTNDTPVEELYTTGKIDNSSHKIEHASDIIRYLTLWKYGGIYLDLDVVVLESLEKVTLNYAGCEFDRTAAAGVLSFAPDGNGHQWAEICINDLKSGYNGRSWSNSSTGVIRRLLKSICERDSLEKATTTNCQGFTLYARDVFYPVPWTQWRRYFEEKDFEHVIRSTENSKTLHMWNKLSKDEKISLDNVYTSYLYYAKKACPKVIAACDKYF